MQKLMNRGEKGGSQERANLGNKGGEKKIVNSQGGSEMERGDVEG